MRTHRYKQEAAGLHGRLRVTNIEHDSLQDEVACLHAQRDTLLAACEAAYKTLVESSYHNAPAVELLQAAIASTQEALANARLIAATPDLLGACELAWADYGRYGDISATTLELMEQAIFSAKTGRLTKSECTACGEERALTSRGLCIRCSGEGA